MQNKIKSFFSKKSIYFDVYNRIMNNFQILSNIAKIKNKKIFILNKSSNLNKIKGFVYQDYRKVKT